MATSTPIDTAVDSTVRHSHFPHIYIHPLWLTQTFGYVHHNLPFRTLVCCSQLSQKALSFLKNNIYIRVIYITGSEIWWVYPQPWTNSFTHHKFSHMLGCIVQTQPKWILKGADLLSHAQYVWLITGECHVTSASSADEGSTHEPWGSRAHMWGPRRCMRSKSVCYVTDRSSGRVRRNSNFVPQLLYLTRTSGSGD